MMNYQYKLGKIFGPSMVFAGYILLAFGLLTVYFSLASLGLVVLGCILAFTTSETSIDVQKNRYKITLKLAGFIALGKERSFEKNNRIEVKRFKGTHVTYSRSNRQSAVEVSDFRVYLIPSGSRNKILLARFNNKDEASETANTLQTCIPES